MKKIRFIKVFVLTLITAITFTMINPLAHTYAESNTKKEDLIIVNSDRENFIYTYIENGVEYKVKENSTEDYKYIESEIYSKVKGENYELVEMRTFNMDDDYATQIIKNVKTGSVETEKVQVSNLISVENTTKISKNDISTRKDPEAPVWKYSQTLKTSTRIAKFTLSAVVSIVTTGVAYYFAGPIGTPGANVINGIAQMIISENIPNIWFTHVYYLTFKPGTNFILGEKKVTSVYKNSARTSMIKSPVTTYYWR